MSPSSIESTSLVEVLQRRAEHAGARVAYHFLVDGEVDGRVERLDYRTLDARARALGAHLQAAGLRGERALLLYPPGLDYVVAFFGCLFAEVIAVPAFPPDPARIERTLPRLLAIARDCDASVVLTLSQIAGLAAGMSPELGALRWISSDLIEAGEAEAWARPDPDLGAVAFLQYTSGSTATPRGVMVTHANLRDDAAQIARGFAVHEDVVGVSWLPPYHDMGLIGAILQPMFSGCSQVLMAPAAFLQAPARWLRAISRFRGTVANGPNFAFDLCARKITDAEKAGLDLSCWSIAGNGAEPVRADTLDRFFAAFAASGLRREALYPCYGLAESTLFVTGGVVGERPVITRVDDAALARLRVVPDAEGRPLVSSGRPWLTQEVRIVDPLTCLAAAPDAVGEIWTRGPSVAAGYWGRPEASREIFAATLADTGEGPFLRTGDLGFLHEGQLYVTGRLKDLVVIRGRNLWPQDVERTVVDSHPAVRPGGAAVFAVEGSDGEGLGILAEVRGDELAAIAEAIRGAVAEAHGVVPEEISLAPAGALLKTSSGKVQRFACRAGVADGTVPTLYRLHQARRAPVAALPMSLMFFSSNAEAEGDLYALLLEASRAADRLGFEAVWIPERHFHPFGGLFPNPAILAAAVAASTRRIGIRAGSVVLPLHDPLRVAEEWAVVDRLSRGRVGVAFAIGWNPNDFVLAPERFGGRKEVTYAGIEAVRRLWRGEAVPRTNGAGDPAAVRVYPRPEQAEIPLWLTCSGGEARFVEAGERGFHVLTALLFQTPEELAGRIAAYRAARARAGLDPAAGRVTLMVHTFVGEDAAAVDAAVARPLEDYLASSVDLWRKQAAPLDALSPGERADVLAYAARRYRQQSSLIGTPEACASMLDRLRAAGVDEVACLIDFGVETRAVLDGLEALDRLRRGAAPTRALGAAGAVATPPRVEPAPNEALVAMIRGEAEAVLGSLPPDVGGDTAIQALALDSLRAVDLGRRLGDRLGRVLPATLLFDHATIGALAEHLAGLVSGKGRAASREVDLQAEAVLPDDVTCEGKSAAFSASPRRVLLTGATGFLGAFLLRELLARTHAQIVCLVRAPTAGAGSRRLREGLAEYGLWDDAWADRVEPLLGDLGAPGFGLSPHALEDLAETLDAIVHNGALVNFAYDYATCRAANVLGTLEVLRLASRGRRLLPVHHVSTAAVFSQAYAGRVVTPADDPADATRLDMGYTQTKWVAERLVLAARARGLPVVIHRPGLVTGSAATGACHRTNFIWNLIRVSIEIGALPDYDRVLDMTPVDWAARVIVDALLSPDAPGAVVHLVNPRPVSLPALGAWLRARGHEIRTESFERWQIRLMQRVIATPSLSALLPILSLAAADFYEHRQVRFDAPPAALPFALSGGPCPPADEALLDTYHRWFVADGFLTAPGAALARPPVRAEAALDSRRLHELVVQITGIDDLGDDAWREPLDVLLADMRRQDYREGGLKRATTRLAIALIRRAQLVDLRRRHPEIAGVPIARPLFIAAPPRTGTTLLHNLLAQDPASRAFALWEMMGPVTPRRAGPIWTSHMVGVAAELIAETYDRSPGLRAIHPMEAGAPDECHWLLASNATSLVNAVTAHAPDYLRWLMRADLRGAYAFYRDALQALSWRRPGGTLACKDPWHLWHLDALLATFPDAWIVQIHRDMAEVVPSLCSLTEALQAVETRPPEARVIGRYGLDLLDEGIQRMTRARALSPGSFIDVDYRALVADPIAVVRSIYAAQRRALSPDAEARMRSFLAAHPQGRHGAHRYGLDKFGLDAGAVAERFSTYSRDFLGEGARAFETT